jgi:HlyD family secretion protein
MPLTTIFLDATEGGVVEEKYVEDGAMLKKGDPILNVNTLILKNLSLANQESQVLPSKHKCRYLIITPSKTPSAS